MVLPYIVMFISHVKMRNFKIQIFWHLSDNYILNGVILFTCEDD